MSEDRPGDDADEATIWAGRLKPWPAAAEPADDVEETRLALRSATPAPDLGGVDETVVARRSAGPVVPAPDDLDEGTVVAPRRASPPPAAAPSVSPPGDAPDAPPIDEGTVVAPRRPAPAAAPQHPVRRAEGRIAAPADTPRNARVPNDAAREIYRPRAAEPVIVPRAAPAAPPPAGPAPDNAAGERRARARRTRVLVAAGAVGLTVLAAIAGIIVLVLL